MNVKLIHRPVTSP